MKTFEQALEIVNRESPASPEKKRFALAERLLQISMEYDEPLERAWAMDWDLLEEDS
jgi:hypothetical protein